MKLAKQQLDIGTMPTVRIGPGLRYRTVQVQHVDQAWPRLADMGFRGENERTSLGETGRVSFIHDPDGGYLEVSGRAEFTGRTLALARSDA